jgi:hypothetical protein
MMEKGSSDAWQNVLSELTDGKVNFLDSRPMLEYFSPLYEWLLNQNLTDSEWNCDSYLNINLGTVKSYSSVDRKVVRKTFSLSGGIKLEESSESLKNSACIHYMLFIFMICMICLNIF